tara:strand:+ start:3725 stop:3895 length:171 start_codon:yes stop_codon:yes gene_type:complete
MARELTETPAGLLAVLIAARKSGDEILAADAERQLNAKFGISITFSDSKQREAAHA